MQRRRLYVQAFPEAGQDVELDEAESGHAIRVLRLVEGQPVVLLDGRGGCADAVVAEAGAGRRRHGVVRCRIGSLVCHPRPSPEMALYVAPPRGRGMGQIVRQAIELGVTRIVPILCRYGVSRPRHARTDSWEQDAVAALKQSGNPWLPVVEPSCDFAAALECCRGTVFYGAVPRHPGSADGGELRGNAFAVWIGPEGGFHEDELTALCQHGGAPVCVGPHILRVETAVCAVLSWVHAMLSVRQCDAEKGSPP